MMIHDLLDMSSGLSYPDDATEAGRAVGKIYEDLMRRCIAPEEHRNLCTYGEYGWDGWLGMYFVNLPKENITLLIGMQKKDAGTFPLQENCAMYALVIYYKNQINYKFEF